MKKKQSKRVAKGGSGKPAEPEKLTSRPEGAKAVRPVTNARANTGTNARTSARSVRADAQRNIDALLETAKEVFVTSGVDAPVREIAEKAGVGVGTVYRHFPQRADLIAAVCRREIDACADAATEIAAKSGPGEALSQWMQRYVDLLAAKRGLAAALHSGDPTYEALPAYFQERLCPALQSLLDAAADAGEVRTEVNPYELLLAVAGLCSTSSHPSVHVGPDHERRMVALFVDGLRYRGSESKDPGGRRRSSS